MGSWNANNHEMLTLKKIVIVQFITQITLTSKSWDKTNLESYVAIEWHAVRNGQELFTTRTAKLRNLEHYIRRNRVPFKAEMKDIKHYIWIIKHTK